MDMASIEIASDGTVIAHLADGDTMPVTNVEVFQR